MVGRQRAAERPVPKMVSVIRYDERGPNLTSSGFTVVAATTEATRYTVDHPCVEPLTADSATALGNRLIVRNSLVAYSPTPPANKVAVPSRSGPAAPASCPAYRRGLGHVSHRRPQPLLRSNLFQTGGVHAAELLLQVRDFVADSSGQLELEIARGGHHLRGQILDEVGEFGPRHVRGVAAFDDARR